MSDLQSDALATWLRRHDPKFHSNRFDRKWPITCLKVRRLGKPGQVQKTLRWLPMLTLFTGDAVRDRDARLQEISRTVTRETIQLLGATAVNMNADELRGYVRSRAAADVRRQVLHAIEQGHLSRQQEKESIAAVLERVVRLVAREAQTQPIAPLPLPHVYTRHAA